VGFFSRLFDLLSVRLARYSGRDVKRAVTPEAVKKGSRAETPENEQILLRRDMIRTGLGSDQIANEFSRKYNLHPREAYRIACGFTLQEAVDSFNGYAMRTGQPTKAGLTVDDLRGYEGILGGEPPPLAILDLLAQVYETDAYHLVDFRDYMSIPPRERALLDGEKRTESQSGQSFSALLIGQATAILALAVAVIYAAGGLELGFKIWFIRDTWAPVLGGLPQDLVLVNAIDDIIPAFVVAIPVYYLYRKLYHPDTKRGRLLIWQARATLISAAAASLVTRLFLLYTERFFDPGVLRSWYEIVAVCFVINVVVIGLAFFVLRLVDGHIGSRPLRQFLGFGVVAIALIPCIASAYAAFPLPRVVLCGAGFYYHDSAGRRYMVGNLIGSNGQWVYVAETHTFNNFANGHYISVVPLSAVDDETIGQSAECNNLAPAPKPS
jgi:hypothetical protein